MRLDEARLKTTHLWVTIGLRILSIFVKSRENNGLAFWGEILPGYTIAVISAMRRASTRELDRAPGPTSSAPKQWKSDPEVDIKS